MAVLSAPRTERLRGRKAVETRRRRLNAEPLCRMCKAKGIVRVATVVDHIKPLALGGTDDDANCRSLCEPCHVDATADQFGLRRRIAIAVDGWPKEG